MSRLTKLPKVSKNLQYITKLVSEGGNFAQTQRGFKALFRKAEVLRDAAVMETEMEMKRRVCSPHSSRRLFPNARDLRLERAS